jgi:leukotriene-A4 hydrolase
VSGIAPRAALWAALALAAHAADAAPAGLIEPERDYHSFANAAAARVKHLDLELTTDFEARRLSGIVDLEVERIDPEARELVLDTRDLTIRKVWLVGGSAALEPLKFALGPRDARLGQPLTIDLPAGDAPTLTVRVSYQTQPQASGLQWLKPEQTAGKAAPFLMSQSQAIHARSWIPLQDTPQVRATYRARIRTPGGLRAVMSADNDPAGGRKGPGDLTTWQFEMPQAIPSYLMALAVGRLDFQAIGPRTGVYAEAPVLESAAKEFAELEKMVVTCEGLFGPYRWGRYDLLILPPSFPFGGMENPRLSFITPTVIAGDRSLVALIAHELAHSWSGNLVTNATWRDFWLNEGFTTYLERRIVEAMYGPERKAMENVLGLQALRRDIKAAKPGDDVLAVDLRGRDPDDAFSEIPYEKGKLFVDWLEARYGREALDAFLREYFTTFAFQSITTERFLSFLEEHLMAKHPRRISEAELTEWIYRPGIPESAVLPTSDAFAVVDKVRQEWLAGRLQTADIPGAKWTTHEWLHFIDNIPQSVPLARQTELDRAFSLTQATNAEIAHSWLLLSVKTGYEPAYGRLEQYLTHVGRRKLIKPLYEALMKAPGGPERARRIFAVARTGYHPIAADSIAQVVSGTPSS